MQRASAAPRRSAEDGSRIFAAKAGSKAASGTLVFWANQYALSSCDVTSPMRSKAGAKAGSTWSRKTNGSASGRCDEYEAAIAEMYHGCENV